MLGRRWPSDCSAYNKALKQVQFLCCCVSLLISPPPFSVTLSTMHCQWRKKQPPISRSYNTMIVECDRFIILSTLFRAACCSNHCGKSMTNMCCKLEISHTLSLFPKYLYRLYGWKTHIHKTYSILRTDTDIHPHTNMHAHTHTCTLTLTGGYCQMDSGQGQWSCWVIFHFSFSVSCPPSTFLLLSYPLNLPLTCHAA